MDKQTIELCATLMQKQILTGRRPHVCHMQDLLGLDVSYHHFKHEFSRVMGIGPAEYMRRWRALIFIKILIDTDYNLDRITLKYGVSDKAQLARMIKRDTGLTSRQIRALSPPERKQLESRVSESIWFPLEMPEKLPETNPRRIGFN